MEKLRLLTGEELKKEVNFVFKMALNIASWLQSVGRKEQAVSLTLELVEVAKLLPPGECRDSRLGFVYKFVGLAFSVITNFEEAIRYTEMSLAIQSEIPHLFADDFKWSTYRLFGHLYKNTGDLKKAKESFEQALACAVDTIQKLQIYKDLCDVYLSLGNDEMAAECMKRGTDIVKGQASKEFTQKCLVGEGGVFLAKGEPRKAITSFKEALAISEEMDHKNEQCRVTQLLGRAHSELDDQHNALLYHEEALALAKQLGHMDIQADQHIQIIKTWDRLGEENKVSESLQELVAISDRLQYKSTIISSSLLIGDLFERKNDLKGTVVAYERTYKLCEEMKDRLEDNDDDKVHISDKLHEAYRAFSRALVNDKQETKALIVADRAKARALADLMVSRYSTERRSAAPTKPLSVVELGRVATQMSNGSDILFTSINVAMVYIWHLAPDGNITLRTKDFSQQRGKVSEFIEAAVGEFYRGIGVGRHIDVDCEDRSLPVEQDRKSEAKWRKQDPGPSTYPSLWNMPLGSSKPSGKSRLEIKGIDARKVGSHACTLLYEFLFAPVADLIRDDRSPDGAPGELVFAPDGHFSFVPFSALQSPDGKCLGERFRIRAVPSLATLKHIRSSPSSYHSDAGALLVGDPEVGEVQYKGRTISIGSLPSARREVQMIGRMLRVEPLVGDRATKQNVLSRIASASLVHLAAHGSPDRGEIALAPVAHAPGVSIVEEDYLLSMADVLSADIRAQLVVLSCCHSGRGDVKAEGVIGIARAFLASGARSVLVALWAIDDEATLHFMQFFYQALVRGLSTSAALHKATNQMKGSESFGETKFWAPFVLIGDDAHVAV